MPNGRSGGFLMKREELLDVLKRIEDGSVVGQPFASREQSPITTEQLKLKVASRSESEILIEEQDHQSYIIHLGNDMDNWLDVERTGPLYRGLRSHHREWLRKQNN